MRWLLLSLVAAEPRLLLDLRAEEFEPKEKNWRLRRD